jgi:transglutaminase-like putative cysteine protease
MRADPDPALALARLAVFAALAAFAAAEWLTLLADPPVVAVAAALAAIAAAAALLALVGRLGIGRWRAGALAAATLAAATAVALVAVGVPASTLVPGGWDELGAGVDRGLAGLGGDVEFPYAGGEPWSRLTLLAGLVLALSVAAALSFWPGRGARSRPSIAGLAILVAIYAAGAAIGSGPESLLAGLALLLLVAAWLWLPGLGPRAALVAGAVVALLGALTLPVAAALEGRPWVDYRDWKLAAALDPRSYLWDHSYGPLAPRDGTPLLEVRSGEPHYWRAAVLDRFDGYSWRRSARDVGQPPLELPTLVDRGSLAGAPQRLNPDWLVRSEFSVRELRSRFAIAPGMLRSAEGLELDPTPNGTTFVEDGALEDGDEYTARGYAPDPSAAEMRAAPQAYAPALRQHTTLELPPAAARGAAEARGEPPVAVPLRGSDPAAASERAGERLAGSSYAQVLALARRLEAGAPTTYDAVKAIELHLQRGYDYVEDVPLASLPLRAFLFERRAGYCEQFSGTMALMLRMLGIPARVATGFSPGTPDGPGRYLVRDLDAHSWVEVYFTGIGWVPFDPTPDDAPAELQTGGNAAASAAGGGPVEGRGDRPAPAVEAPSAAPPSSEGGPPLWAFALGLALPLGAGIALTLARIARHRSLPAPSAAEARTRELAAALERLGWPLRPGITLRRVEELFRAARCPTAAAYVAGLRAIRFGTEGRLPPLSQRRRLRRELRRFPGLRATLASYLAVPPGAPRQYQ